MQMRTSRKFEIKNIEIIKDRLLQWAHHHREVVWLDSNNNPSEYQSFEAVLAVDAFTAIQTDYVDAFKKLHEYQKSVQDWIFGYLTYDVKNAVEDLHSNNYDGLAFPDLFFFQPKKIIFIQNNQLHFEYLNFCSDEIEEDFQSIEGLFFQEISHSTEIHIQQRISKEEYLQKVQALQEHIHRGDIYEVNFCMEFFAENAPINPLSTYQKLNQISQAPFSVYLKNHQHYLLCASPERYLKKQGEQIISQPIKGTAPRSLDESVDKSNKEQLQHNLKERSENIMIVDLVRNDLSKTAQKGSVQVLELCGVYTYKQVHQLISTISSKLHSDYSPVSAIESTFPMGSMTGAPKISAMQLIEKSEETQRGLYSGAVGYFTPTGDFDFNVVIRSILYNAKNQYLSFSSGSAITALSVPEQEYQECLLKAQAMKQVLNSDV